MPNEVANPETPGHESGGFLATLAHIFGDWHFPVAAVTIVVGFALMVVVVVLAPTGETGFGAFAAEFRRWCFDWDGKSSLPIVQVLFMVSELLIFGLVVLVIWWPPVRAAFQTRRRSLLLTVLGALVLLSGSFALLLQLGTPTLAAPVSVQALRTSSMAPPLRLTDQTGSEIELAKLRGQVVLVTAVYATCGNTCPMLFGQAKRAVTALPPELRSDLQVLAITLDPQHDTQAVLAETALAQSISSPLWHLLTGPTALVESTLDTWEVARRRDPETGQIDHANLFMLVDRQGRLAFRLTLSEEREAWLGEALTTLLNEAVSP